MCVRVFFVVLIQLSGALNLDNLRSIPINKTKSTENLKNVEIQSLNLFTTDFLIAFIMWLCILILKDKIKQAVLSKRTLSWIPFH